ncbi:biotin-dependent carboxyltransferase family protein [Singulisphaera sp. PoT]|uniref:5-oxoprolinase subunit C family protein n=1 Tax=Singulisphaera sp. PoT TaxID=3411797 RepID=UPI003BF56995
MAIEVIAPGLFTTIQDLGRPGHAAWGVPPAGAFDRSSLDLANALLGNPPDCAALEMTLLGATLRAQVPLAIALVGAPMEATLQSRQLKAQRLTLPLCFSLESGDVLSLGGTANGARTYLAVKGGWQTAKVLNSRSSELPIQARTILEARPSSTLVRHPIFDLDEAQDPRLLRVIDGPDSGRVEDLDAWLDQPFKVGPQANRMGVRMECPPIALRSEPERMSMPVSVGAVQATGGQLILLGVACGTIGGYPHIAHIISADLDRLAQLRPGDSIRFSRISLDEARRLDREKRRRQRELRQRLALLAGDMVDSLGGD